MKKKEKYTGTHAGHDKHTHTHTHTQEKKTHHNKDTPT